MINKEEVTEALSTCPHTRQKNQPVVHTVVTNSMMCPHNDDHIPYSLLHVRVSISWIIAPYHVSHLQLSICPIMCLQKF